MDNQCDLIACRAKNVPGELMMHSLPRSMKVLNKWKKVLRSFEPSIKFGSNTKICNLHFVETDYDINSVSKQKELKTDAIPSVFPRSTGIGNLLESEMTPSQLSILPFQPSTNSTGNLLESEMTPSQSSISPLCFSNSISNLLESEMMPSPPLILPLPCFTDSTSNLLESEITPSQSSILPLQRYRPYDIQTVFNDQHMYLKNNWPESSATLNTLVHRMSSTTFEEPEDIKAIKERLVKMKKLEVVDVKTTTSTIRNELPFDKRRKILIFLENYIHAQGSQYMSVNIRSPGVWF